MSCGRPLRHAHSHSRTAKPLGLCLCRKHPRRCLLLPGGWLNLACRMHTCPHRGQPSGASTPARGASDGAGFAVQSLCSARSLGTPNTRILCECSCCFAIFTQGPRSCRPVMRWFCSCNQEGRVGDEMCKHGFTCARESSPVQNDLVLLLVANCRQRDVVSVQHYVGKHKRTDVVRRFRLGRLACMCSLFYCGLHRFFSRTCVERLHHSNLQRFPFTKMR